MLASTSSCRKSDHHGVFSNYADTIYALTAAIDEKDHYTFTHSNNVAYYASVLASLYGLNADKVEIVREAGLLYDVGKIGIPEAILQKPASLTADEYEIIKKHPENVVAIIRHLPSLDYVIPAAVVHQRPLGRQRLSTSFVRGGYPPDSTYPLRGRLL